MVSFRNEEEHVDSIRKSLDWTVRALGNDHEAPGVYVGSLSKEKCYERVGFLSGDNVKVPQCQVEILPIWPSRISAVFQMRRKPVA